MRSGFIGSVVVLLALIAFSPDLQAQTPAGPGAAKARPELSGIWEAPHELNAVYGQRSDLCGEGACVEFLKLQPFKLIITLEEPKMLPWAEDKFKAAREGGAKDPNAPGREDADPWFSACTPASPAWLMLSPFIAFELRQFPDVVLLLFGGSAGEGDHVVRRIYLDGRGHPANGKPTWMGHSIGSYDGDTLVVDTIGINGNRWIDPQGHPHSDALHLVERMRRVNPKSLEYEVTIEDPKAYKNSWRKKIVRQSGLSGPRFWDDTNCEELLQMGTHYGAETKK